MAKTSTFMKFLRLLPALLLLASTANAQTTTSLSGNERLFAMVDAPTAPASTAHYTSVKWTYNTGSTKYRTSFISDIGWSLLTGGVVGVGIGVYEIAQPGTFYKQDGTGMILAGVATVGVGLLCLKLGGQYEEKHPEKIHFHDHYHRNYHHTRHYRTIHKNKTGHFRFS
jgi:hypothetical protein